MMLPRRDRGEIRISRESGGVVKRLTFSHLLWVLITLLAAGLCTLGLSGCNSTAAPSPGVSLTPSGTQGIDQGQTVSITATVAHDSKNAGVTWTVSGAGGSQGTLTNVTTTSATYDTPASVTSAFTATVTATSVTFPTKSAALQINVNALPAVTTNSLPAATAGTPYNQPLTVSGGTSPYTWSVTPTLPPGMILIPTSGIIGGTPTGGGSGSFTFKVTDAAGNSATSQALAITVGPPASPLTITTTTLPGAFIGTPYSATVAASGGVPSYTWSLSGNPSWLSINASTGVLSGTPTGTSGSTANFTVTVTDSQTPTHATQSAGLSIVITVAPLQITTTSFSSGTEGTAYNATVTASGGVPPYINWIVNTGSLPTGLSLNSSTGAISGTPTALGTSTFTVQVTDSETPAVTATSASLSITISATQACTGTLNNGLLKGNYAMLLNGWKTSATTASSVLGSFMADGNGNITGGVLDIADQNNSAPTNTTFTGKYCVGSNNLATVTMNPAVGNTSTLEAALDASDGNGHIIEYDNSGLLASGLLRQQTTSAFSTAAIKGNYAFGLVGADQSAGRFAAAGQFNADGNGDLVGESDNDDNGSLLSQQTFSASGFSVASSGTQAGRGTAAITGVTNRTTNFVFYVVNANEMLMMAIDTETTPVILAGQVLVQASSLTDSTLDGVSVIEIQDLDTGNSPATSEAQAGILTVTNPGSFSLAMDDNDGGTLKSNAITGDYSVESSTGRMTLSNVTGCGGGCNHNPVFYLVGPNQAFAVGTDSSVNFGTLTPQSGSSFTAASLKGNYLGGSQPPANWNTDVEADYVNSDGVSALTGISDKNTNGGPQPGAISASYCMASSGTNCTTSSNGRVVVSQGGVEQVILYIISPTQAVVLGTQDTNPKLVDFHQ